MSKADIDGLSLPIEPILMEPEPELKKGENVMIIQHPKGRQKQFSQEKILKVEKPFVFYKADTERGSSGSPVLTSEGLALVAVHHKGCKKGGYNKGSLISEILKDLQEGSCMFLIYCTFLFTNIDIIVKCWLSVVGKNHYQVIKDLTIPDCASISGKMQTHEPQILSIEC